MRWMAWITAFLLVALPVLLFTRTGYPAVVFLKWCGTFSIVAYGSGFCGFYLLSRRDNVKLAFPEMFWFLMAFLFALQPFFISIRSFPEWLRNWYFFAFLGGAVFLFRNLPIEKVLSWILRSISFTGAISTSFGFIQTTWPEKRFPFIMNTSAAPDRFLGNTGLDGILGVYLALAVIAGFWLLLNEKQRFCWLIDSFLLPCNCLGLWKTGARSAFIACFVGVIVLLCSSREKRRALKIFFYAIASLIVMGAVFFSWSPELLRIERRDMSLLLRLEQFSSTQEGRWTIWNVSGEMIKKNPIWGVGLGNYKWNYMDAMASLGEKGNFPRHYTYWAHNEYLQWTAETGFAGAALLFSFLTWAAVRCAKKLKGKNGDALSWALAAMAVLAVDACFSRPFHHVDTAFTLSLVLGLISRLAVPPMNLTRLGQGIVGGGIVIASVLGIYLFASALPRQNYLGENFYNPFYLTLLTSAEREKIWNPLFVRDAFQQLLARENVMRAQIEGKEKDMEQNQLDAIRTLENYFATQPRFDELNELLLLYQKRKEYEKGKPYLKYYPPEERRKFEDDSFEGKYMGDGS